MLGNWSFGDYFKKEAIEWAWELLTKESFWEMGDTGPCGPCSEIHYDRVGNRDAASLVSKDDPTCLEIWNLVFIQRTKDGPPKPLPSKHVDTGMGFERLTSVLQNKMSNYDTDVFLPIFDDIQKATGARPYSGKVGQADVDRVDTAYRVVADHIRTLLIAIADGSRSGNEGCQHVLRSILRRGVRYGKEILKAEEGFFNGIWNTHYILTILVLSLRMAFNLWSTYGFPVDLTLLMAEEIGLAVDVDGFYKAEKEAKEISKSAQKNQAGVNIVMNVEAISTLLETGVSATDDSFKYIWFQDHETEVKAIYNGSDDKVGLVLASTSFYAEQGGQIFDTRLIEGSFGAFIVGNVQTVKGFFLHIGNISSEAANISVGDKVTCKVDYKRRKLIANNHTCTHMLNFALKKVLGDHIKQKGSIVLPEKLRFDLSHVKPVDPEELRNIDSIVNNEIKDELDVFSKKTPLYEAKRIKGVREELEKAS